MPHGAWISRVFVSRATATKLAAKHGLDADDVCDAIEGVTGLPGAWDDHPERGLRLLLQVPMNRRTVLVVLYPREEEDEWNLASAYHV